LCVLVGTYYVGIERRDPSPYLHLLPEKTQRRAYTVVAFFIISGFSGPILALGPHGCGSSAALGARYVLA
jgi:hypothetical protein